MMKSLLVFWVLFFIFSLVACSSESVTCPKAAVKNEEKSSEYKAKAGAESKAKAEADLKAKAEPASSGGPEVFAN
ncbi:hypothetical protein [Mesobacillus thioparans]|uniref:hypothetical protein n=1 Tax=Mesobacillus thioparans TaxID=370439 RepID=UPI0039F0E40C